ncbi:MAG: ABC transporter substrate-binding protein [Amylibacter sp.]|nr:ABC transporter substrate-binding protein [Amylibacter sp.]
MGKLQTIIGVAFLGLTLAHGAFAGVLKESTYFIEAVKAGKLPPVEQRIPDQPLIVDLAAKGRTLGQQGGMLRTMITRSKDTRQMVVYGYSRLVIYDQNYKLQPDLLESYDNVDDKKFTFHLRKGHKWSDGEPFNATDFEYWWEDVANNDELMPSGPPEFLRVEGELPQVSFPDDLTIIYEWSKPNPQFLQILAQARPPFIFRPAHYLNSYHLDFADAEQLQLEIKMKKVRSWASLHNKVDNMYKFDNADLPTLQPWVIDKKSTKSRRIFTRNPFYHRIDLNGVQLPYIDQVEMSIVGAGLVAAKANAAEVDLQARGLSFKDISILKKGEKDSGKYRTLLWANGVASQIAIYPNLNFADPVWRKILRDVRFRRALSLSIDRRMINRALYFGLAKEGAMTALPASPFYDVKNSKAWAQYDLKAANTLLDEMGLTKRRADGIRLLPDGRPMMFVVETAGERQEVENALQITTDTWRDIGVKLVIRPLDRDILRSRVSSGVAMAAVWFGWDNGLPQPYTSPAYLAPRQQDFFAWPKWGQYFLTEGKLGEKVDMPAPQRLLDLSLEWDRATNDQTRSDIWREMLKIHADEVYGISILAEAPQPVVVSNRLRNVPENAIWAWEPGAHFGIHRMDEFYIDESAAQ